MLQFIIIIIIIIMQRLTLHVSVIRMTNRRRRTIVSLIAAEFVDFWKTVIWVFYCE